MALKIIGYYNETALPGLTDADTLLLEISNYELVCLVRSAVSQEIEGFELFRLGDGQSDWSDALYEAKTESRLLNRAYRDIHGYFNTEEVVIIPGNRYTGVAAEDYLNLLYGESSRHDLRHETIAAEKPMINAYRVRKSLNELVSRYFVLYQPHHVYSALLKEVLAQDEQALHYLKVQIYGRHLIAVVMKEHQLQLVQSFSYTTQEDILYHLLNIAAQLQLDASQSHLEISGMFEPGSLLHQQLQPKFGLISFEGIKPDGVFKTAGNYPSHYFTPYYKLVV